MKHAALVVLLVPGLVAADEVLLKSGGRLSGVVVDWNEERVVLETGPGRLVLPTHAVKRVVPRADPLARYAERARRLDERDIEGWLALGLWAREAGLLTQASDALERVVALDPDNALAQEGLGRVRHDGRWLTPEERYRALGYVPFEGGWVTPAEHEAALREQRVAADERRARRREMEERAREARRVADDAAAAAAAATAAGNETTGIPLGYVWGSSGYWGGYGGYYGQPTRPHRPVHHPRHGASGARPPSPTFSSTPQRSGGHTQASSGFRQARPSRPAKGARAGVRQD